MVRGSAGEALKEELRARIEQQLRESMRQAGMGSPASSSEWLRFEATVDAVQIGPMPVGCIASLTLSLMEPVAPLRDPSLRVPGGGGLTWWRTTLVSTEASATVQAIEDFSRDMSAQFLDSWRMTNQQATGPN